MMGVGFMIGIRYAARDHLQSCPYIRVRTEHLQNVPARSDDNFFRNDENGIDWLADHGTAPFLRRGFSDILDDSDDASLLFPPARDNMLLRLEFFVKMVPRGSSYTVTYSTATVLHKSSCSKGTQPGKRGTTHTGNTVHGIDNYSHTSEEGVIEVKAALK
jgi:hypothetical protein